LCNGNYKEVFSLQFSVYSLPVEEAATRCRMPDARCSIPTPSGLY